MGITTSMLLVAAGAILSIAFWASWGGFRRRTIVSQGPVTRIETVVR
jgi:hypothetical protein